MTFTLERARQGLDTISVTGNVLRVLAERVAGGTTNWTYIREGCRQEQEATRNKGHHD